jgi:hypothetical protein
MAQHPDIVDVELTRHASEPSRYVLAVVTSSLVLGLLVIAVIVSLGRTVAALMGLVVLGLLVILWLGIQLKRVRMLAAAVKVSARTTPELQNAINRVRGRLDYRKRTDVYVTDSTDTPVTLISLFGTRILVLKGDFVADLVNEGKEPELIFLLATYFGALKARYDRLNAVLVALAMVDSLKFVSPFLNPWYRATVYSGDQLAFVCCQDLNVSLSIAFRSLVGKEMAAQIRASGLIDQARQVRQSFILRLSQLFAPVPHPTNRYLNLLAFAGHETALQYAVFQSSLDADVAQYLEGFRIGHRVTGGSSAITQVGDAIAGSILVLALITGVIIGGGYDSSAPTGHDIGPTNLVNPETSASEPSENTSSNSTSGGDTGSSLAYATLVARLPSEVAFSCEDVTSDPVESSPGVEVVARCHPGSSGSPETVTFYSYPDHTSADAAFEQLMGDSPQGVCGVDDPSVTTWSFDGVDRGPLGCFTGINERAVLVWVDDQYGVLTIAIGEPGDTVKKVFRWWRQLPVLTN